MSLLTRMIDAVRPRVTKDTRISPNNPTFVRMFGWTDSDDLKDPYSQLPIVYAAVHAVGKVLSQTAIKVMKGEKEVGDKDPLALLFKKPNVMQSPYEFKEGIGVNLQVKGNAFIVLDEQLQPNGIPVAMYAWPARYFTPKFDRDNNWVGWDVKRGKGEPVFYPPERVVHISGYNPNDELLGMAPLDVLKMSYKSMWDALVYNKKFFENDGTPPLVYKAKEVLPPEYREAFRKDMIERRRGLKHSHEAQLVEAMEVQTLGFTNKDIQFLELLKQNENDVLMVFGVTKTQVSKYEDVNYATALSQDKVFITNTVIPIMREIESDFNSQWLEALGYRIEFDERSNEAMTYLSKEEADKYVALANAQLVTINEAREKMGYEPVEWGDDPPAKPEPVMPVPPQLVQPKPEEPVSPVPPAKSLDKSVELEAAMSDAFGKARRTNLWNSLNNKIKPVESKCASAVRRYFYEAEKRVLNAVKAKMAGGALVKVADPDIDNAFNDADLYDIVRKYLGQSIVMGAGTLGVQDVNIDDPGILQYLGDRVQFMKGVNDTAKEGLKTKLHDALQSALENKLTEDDTMELVRTALSDGFDQLKSHARSIARTEVHGAFTEGRWQACQDINPSEIEWISSRDPFVRDTHREYDGQRIPFGSEFAPGLHRPHDPMCPEPGEVINCRCNFQIHI